MTGQHPVRRLETNLPTLKTHHRRIVFITTLAFLLMWGVPLTRAQNTACPGTPPSNLRVGVLGQVTFTDGTRTNLRDRPSRSGTILARMPEGQLFEVIGGPRCADGYLWWQLSLFDQQLVGWAAEGDLYSYFIEPTVGVVGAQESLTRYASSIHLTRPQLIAFLSSDHSQIQIAEITNLANPITLYRGTPGYYSLGCPQWSSDGRYVAVEHAPLMSDYTVELFVFDVSTRRVVRNTTLSASHRHVVWSPDLSRVAYAGPLLDSDFSSNPVGKLSRSHGITILDLATNRSRYLAPLTDTVSLESNNEYRGIMPVSWSPDGSNIAFEGIAYYGASQTFGFISVNASQMTERNVDQIFRVPLDSSELIFLDFDWSTDSRTIYYSYLGRLYSSSLDIYDRKWLFGTSSFPVRLIDVSPDGSWIVFERILGFEGDALIEPMITDLWAGSTREEYFTPYRVGGIGTTFIDWVDNQRYLIRDASGNVYLVDGIEVSSSPLGHLDASCAAVQPAPASGILSQPSTGVQQPTLPTPRPDFSDSPIASASAQVNMDAVNLTVARALRAVLEPRTLSLPNRPILLIRAAADLGAIASQQLGRFDIVCAPITAIPYLQTVLGEALHVDSFTFAADYVCTWGQGIAAILSAASGAVPFALVPILIEPDKYINPWLDPLNEAAWRLPITCTLFPDASVCQWRQSK